MANIDSGMAAAKRACEIAAEFGNDRDPAKHIAAILELWRSGHKDGMEFVLKQIGENAIKKSTKP